MIGLTCSDERQPVRDEVWCVRVASRQREPYLFSRFPQRRIVRGVQITVQTKPGTAQVLRGREKPSTEVLDLRERLDEFGVTLEPVHPPTDDPLLDTYFTVDAPEEKLSQILKILTDNPIVDAAYLKPADELP